MNATGVSIQLPHDLVRKVSVSIIRALIIEAVRQRRASLGFG